MSENLMGGIGVAFIGAGSHARHHIKEFSRLLGVRLHSVYDIDTARAEAASKDFSPLAADSLESLLADADISAVIIATPAETHRALTAAALAAGKHVLLEKPIAHNAEDARAIAEMTHAFPNQILLIGHCERFNPSYRDAAKAVRDGHIGTPRFASASRLSPLRLNDPNWKLGPLDTAVHDMDILLWLMGDAPVAVAAQGVTAAPELTIPDQIIYQIRFAGGGLAQGHIGWIPFGDGYPMGGNAHPRLLIVGTGGSLTLDLWNRPVAVQSRESGAYFWPDSVLVGYADYFTEVSAQDFAFLAAVQAAQSGKPVELTITPSDACRALEVAFAAYRSLHHEGGAFVPVND